MRTPVIALALLAATGTVAAAQTLPETSRAAATAQGIQRDLGAQGQIRGIQQQNQFEVNQLRAEQRSSTITAPLATPGTRICAAGAC